MNRFNCMDAPIEINGLLSDYKKGKFYKLNECMFDKVSETITRLGQRSTGGRIRFRTDAKSFSVKVVLQTLSVDRNFTLLGSAGCPVIAGLGDGCTYLGCVNPYNYEDKTNEATFELKGDQVEDITIYFPRNEKVEDVEIILEDGARMLPPTPFDYENPIIFYGSSITEGCTAVHSANSYVAVTSRWLNADYVNLGFSGAAKGEPVLAEYIKSLPMAAFVMDYDHNAPSKEHLEATHENFFKIIREAHPTLPILILSRPDFDSHKEENAKRRDIVKRTYLNALAKGDQHVEFIDGETFFGERGRFACTIDGCHPSDVGMMRMAEKVYPVLYEMLKKNS